MRVDHVEFEDALMSGVSNHLPMERIVLSWRDGVEEQLVGVRLTPELLDEHLPIDPDWRVTGLEALVDAMGRLAVYAIVEERT